MVSEYVTKCCCCPLPPTLGDNDGSGTASLGKCMAYSDFTLQKLKKDFGLQVDEQRNLFAAVELVAGSELLNNTLQETVQLAIAINTEKARSEMDGLQSG